jgi:nucleolar protein 6
MTYSLLGTVIASSYFHLEFFEHNRSIRVAIKACQCQLGTLYCNPVLVAPSMSKKRKHDHLEGTDAPASAVAHYNNEEPAKKSTKTTGQLKQEKSERRSKKQKTATLAEDEPRNIETEAEAGSTKAKSASKSTPSTVVTTDPPTNALVKSDAKSKKRKKKSATSSTDDTAAHRFIVFVGNLPYNTTVPQLTIHFAKIAPQSIRLSTDKVTGKGKGFAFLEFDNYDKMKTCLKVYHHSWFDPDWTANQLAELNGEDEVEGAPGKNPHFNKNRPTGRRINVELTAGGGGKKSEGRKTKIQEKNKKLEEQRERQRIKDKAEQEKSRAERKKGPAQSGVNATEMQSKDGRGDIHPSRMARVQY